MLTREVRGLVDEKYQDDIDVVTHAFGTAVYGWAKSTLLCALITGVASWLCFLILGIPYSVVLGFLVRHPVFRALYRPHGLVRDRGNHRALRLAACVPHLDRG